MKNIIFLFAIAFMMACTPGNKASEVSIQDLKNQVMDIHDEVMPKMGELRKTAKTLRESAEVKEAEEDMMSAEDLIRAAEAIEAANESMMVWMRQFEPDFKGTDDESRAYLNDQMKQVNEVRDAMNSSLDAGTALLN